MTDLVVLTPFYIIDSRLYAIKILRIVHLNRCLLPIKGFIIQVLGPRGFGLSQRVKIYFWLFFALHFLTCVWIFIARHSLYEVNWIIVNKVDGLPFLDVYINSIYFIVTTIAAVGFGAYAATNPLEMIVCMFIEVIQKFWLSYSFWD